MGENINDIKQRTYTKNDYYNLLKMIDNKKQQNIDIPVKNKFSILSTFDKVISGNTLIKNDAYIISFKEFLFKASNKGTRD